MERSPSHRGVAVTSTFSHSIKIEETQKGIRVHVHVYSNSEQDAVIGALSTYEKTLAAFKEKGQIMAPMINGGSAMKQEDDKTLTLEQKRELLQDIFGSNEEVIESAIRFLKEEEDQSCGGESCTDDEKEDSTTDEDVPPLG